MAKSLQNKGWTVVMAGTGINLALGVLYTWSIFKGAISDSIKQGGEGAFQWDLASINDPYAVCCLVFAFSMILAGKCQDHWGPRVTALIGGLLVGAGFLLLSQTSSYWLWVLGFGGMAGMGFGFGYSSATPPALKWFPPARTGLIAGIVVSGFGLASVYIAPLSTYLLKNGGLHGAMLFFGIAFAVVVALLSTFLANPPAGYLFGGAAAKTKATQTAAPVQKSDFTASEMLKTSNFYVLWLVYFVGAGAGLMVIGSVAGMAKQSMGELAFLAVAILAIGNAAGRIIAGSLSDKIGRTLTLTLMLAFQAILMFVAIPVISNGQANAAMLVLLATGIGFNYGTNLALFPALTKDFWGLKNFGANYGLLFTAWGVGGFVLGRASEMMKVSTGSFGLSFGVAGTLLTAAALLLAVQDLRRQLAQAHAAEAKPTPQVELEPVPVQPMLGKAVGH